VIGACAGIFFTVMMLAFAARSTCSGRAQRCARAGHALSQCCFSVGDLDLAGEYAGLGDTRYRRHADSVGDADRVPGAGQIVVGARWVSGCSACRFGMRGVAAGQLAAFTLGPCSSPGTIVSGRSRLMLNLRFTFQRDMFFDILKVAQSPACRRCRLC